MATCGATLGDATWILDIETDEKWLCFILLCET